MDARAGSDAPADACSDDVSADIWPWFIIVHLLGIKKFISIPLATARDAGEVDWAEGGGGGGGGDHRTGLTGGSLGGAIVVC